jgi:hypothetical protein
MFTNRFLKLRAFFPDMTGGGTISHVYVNPLSIEAFVEERIEYTSQDGIEMEEECIRLVTRADVFEIVMNIDAFKEMLNNHYAN